MRSCAHLHAPPQIALNEATRKIWRKIVEGNISAAYIFEDDVIFHQDLATVFPLVSRGPCTARSGMCRRVI